MGPAPGVQGESAFSSRTGHRHTWGRRRPRARWRKASAFPPGLEGGLAEGLGAESLMSVRETVQGQLPSEMGLWPSSLPLSLPSVF